MDLDLADIAAYNEENRRARIAYWWQMAHQETGRKYLPGCPCGYCSRDREMARLRWRRRKEAA